MSEEYEIGCYNCMHRIRQFCRAYKFDIKTLNSKNCKRFKKSEGKKDER